MDMNISKYFTWSTLLIVNLTMGMSLPLYAAEPNPDLTPTTSTSVSEASTSANQRENSYRHIRHYHHYRHHCYQHLDCHKDQYFVKDMNRDSINWIQQDTKNAEHGIWKNGVNYHDVNPIGQSRHIHDSTSDTLQGGVTTTDEHQ
jgi:hypothetical protein